MIAVGFSVRYHVILVGNPVFQHVKWRSWGGSNAVIDRIWNAVTRGKVQPKENLIFGVGSVLFI